MAYILRPITGTGTKDDPFRPSIPNTIPPITSLPGFRWTADIPTGANGQPLFADCYVWIPDSFTLPPGVVVIPMNTARFEINARDPKVNPRHMEAMP